MSAPPKAVTSQIPATPPKSQTQTEFDPTRVCGGDPLKTLSCLLRAVNDLNSARDLSAGLQRVADGLRKSIAFDTFSLLLLDDDGEALHFDFTDGLPEEIAGHWRFGLGQGIPGHVAATGEALVVNDVREDPRYLRILPEVRAEAAFPLSASRRTIGVLSVGSFTTDFFTESHERFLGLIAGHLAAAIENHRLYNNLRRQTQVLSALHEASREITSILDRRELLARMADLVKRHIDYQLFNVMLWDEDKRHLEAIFTAQGKGCKDKKHTLALGQGLCGTAAALRQPVRVGNVHRDPRYENCGKHEVASELVVPLLFEERLIGVLDLESDRFNAFTNEDEQFLSTLASNVAIALENAHLYERLREDESKLAKDLDTARTIQRYLLPKTTPWTAGLQIAVEWSPSRHLGGDLYDIFSYADQRTAIALGDVAGKGSAAALYGSLALGLLRGYAPESCGSPLAVLGYLNQELAQLSVERRFLALAYAVYDPKDRTLEIANAGLPYPRLLRGGEVHEIEASGMPLGAMMNSAYEAIQLTLEPGDVLVLASDGLEERLDATGAQFGGERLDECLRELAGGSAREIADGLIAAGDRFAGGVDPSDDRTLAVLKVADNVIT